MECIIQPFLSLLQFFFGHSLKRRSIPALNWHERKAHRETQTDRVRHREMSDTMIRSDIPLHKNLANFYDL